MYLLSDRLQDALDDLRVKDRHLAGVSNYLHEIINTNNTAIAQKTQK